MTPPYTEFSPDVYRLSKDLSERGLSVGQSFDATEQDELVFDKLGARVWGRLCYFRRYYSADWGERGNRPLSPRAIGIFCRFLEHATFPANLKPSLFLTSDGTLELCFEDKNGKAVEFEFTPSEVRFFLESDGDEGADSPSGAAEITKRLATT